MLRGRAIATRWITLVVMSLIVTWAAASQPVAQQVSLSGWFHIIWEDPPPGSNIEPVTRYVLIDDQGRWTELLLDKDVIRPFGGPLAFNRKRVVVIGEWESVLPEKREGIIPHQPRFQVRSIQFERPEDAEAAALGATALAVTGSQPWVTILCRFADLTDVTPHDVSWFSTLMGTSYPGMDHYWRELSYENINLTGSTVVGWYNLPQPRSYYIYDTDGDGKEDTIKLYELSEDCTVVADTDVFFPSSYGINLMFNDDLGCCAYGGSTTLTLDGQTKSYGITRIPPWGYENQDVLGHEMGHGFGLPHSSGPYGYTYDSKWDVMSRGASCSPPHPEYGCIGIHTISFHKDLLGWIPSTRKYVTTPGSSQTITIERLGQPVSSSNYLMAQIPIDGSDIQFYTVEARRFAGYDVGVPGEAIVIHKVDTTTLDDLLGDRFAQVVDVDGNGNPNDAGAMWTPGETFTDTANGITVSVNAATSTSFEVTITWDGPFTLTVTKAGTGSGTVTSSPAGIDCGTDCTETYAIATVVTLTAIPDSGYILAGWSGHADCADGSVTMYANKTCTAIFDLPGTVSFAYISNFESDTVSVINTVTNTVIATVPVGDFPIGVAVNPAGTRVYVTHLLDNGIVSVIDTTTNTVIATVPVGNKPIGVAVNPAGTRVYVANSNINIISVIDTATHTVTPMEIVWSFPHGVAVHPDGTRVYVTIPGYDIVLVINTTTNTVVVTVPVGDYPESVVVHPDGTRVYVANQASDTVSVIDTTTNTVTTTVPVGNAPRDVAVHPDGTQVYVANYYSGTVSVIDTTTDTVMATVPAGYTPQGVAVNPAGTRVYVANGPLSDTVSVIDTTSYTVVAIVPVGDWPNAVDIGPAPPLGIDLTGAFTRLTRKSFGSLDRLSFTLAVQNNGTAATEGAFEVALYLSADTTLDSSDLLLTGLSVSDLLGSGEAVELSGRLRVSGPTSGQFVLAVVDANGDIEETDEGNNVVAGAIP